jgi:hypothetical protein
MSEPPVINIKVSPDALRLMGELIGKVEIGDPDSEGFYTPTFTRYWPIPPHPHGFDDVPFDDYRIPGWIWKRLTQDIETGCWEWAEKKPNDIHPAVVMAMRLLGVQRGQIYAAVQTCANPICARPAHICVTLKG